MRSICRIAFLLVVPVALVSSTRGEEKENPIEAEVKASLKDPAKPFTMLVRVKIKDGAEKKFEAAFAKAVAGTRKEKGNKAYELNRFAKTPTEYLVYERWQDLASLQAHLKAPHIVTLLAEIGDLLDSPPEVKVLVPIGH